MRHLRKKWCSLLLAAPLVLNCGGKARSPERCRNLTQNSRWLLPAFAKPEGSPGGVESVVVEDHADGAIAQNVPKPPEMSGLGVIAIGYARVETPKPVEPSEEDVTGQLWTGAVVISNSYQRKWGGFDGPYTRLRFSAREAASGSWKRFVTRAIPADKARLFYPHFAFWEVRFAPGVKLHVAALSLVAAPADDGGEPEAWAGCPTLPAPSPALASVTMRQWVEHLGPDGAFQEPFEIAERSGKESGWQDLVLTARYRQGARVADRFLVAVTEDGSDPRLSPTSRVQTILAGERSEQWQALASVKKGAHPIRIAVAAAAGTDGGLRTQTPQFPSAWQKP